MSDLHRRPGSGPSSAEVRLRLASELRLPSRLGFTALLLAGMASAALACALLLTEPGLPAGTRVAFVVMALIGTAWAGFATWVLARRRVLFASHRVVAARMSVVFTATFTGGAFLLTLQEGRQAGGLAAAAVGAAMLTIAIILLWRARRRVDELIRRRRELELLLEDAEAGR
jgi:hypothetical protein